MTKEKIDKLTGDEFEPYSHEWEKEMMKFTKPYLITWLRDSLMKQQQLNLMLVKVSGDKKRLESIIEAETIRADNWTKEAKNIQKQLDEKVERNPDIEDQKRQFREDRNERKNESLK